MNNQQMDMFNRTIYFIKRYYEVNKQFPKIRWLYDRLELKSYSKIKTVLGILEHSGYVRRNKSTYFVTQKLLDHVIQENISTDNKIGQPKNNGTIAVQYVIIRIVMLIIGIGAVLLSCYFSIRWLLEYLHIFWAFILGFIMVLFSAFSPEALILFKLNRNWLMMVIISITWITALSFSMISTVAVLYNQLMIEEKEEIEKKTENIFKNLEWEMYNINEEEIVSLIKEKEEELKIVNNLLKQFDNLDIREEKKDEWLSGLYTKRKAEEVIEKYRMELKEIREKKLQFAHENKEEAGSIQETTVQIESFYVWIAGIFNLESDKVQFWVSVFPAVFIDIIAPIALAIAMFLRRRKYEKS